MYTFTPINAYIYGVNVRMFLPSAYQVAYLCDTQNRSSCFVCRTACHIVCLCGTQSDAGGKTGKALPLPCLAKDPPGYDGGGCGCPMLLSPFPHFRHLKKCPTMAIYIDVYQNGTVQKKTPIPENGSIKPFLIFLHCTKMGQCRKSGIFLCF